MYLRIENLTFFWKIDFFHGFRGQKWMLFCGRQCFCEFWSSILSKSGVVTWPDWAKSRKGPSLECIVLRRNLLSEVETAVLGGSRLAPEAPKFWSQSHLFPRRSLLLKKSQNSTLFFFSKIGTIVNRRLSSRDFDESFPKFGSRNSRPFPIWVFNGAPRI